MLRINENPAFSNCYSAPSAVSFGSVGKIYLERCSQYFFAKILGTFFFTQSFYVKLNRFTDIFQGFFIAISLALATFEFWRVDLISVIVFLYYYIHLI